MSEPVRQPLVDETTIVIGETNTRDVVLGERLFSLDRRCWAELQEHLDQCGLVTHDVVLIDARGRVCRRALQFQRAEQDKAFPITAYNVNPPISPL